MSVPGEKAPTAEASIAGQDIAEETAITIKEAAKGEETTKEEEKLLRAPVSNYWVGTLALAVDRSTHTCIENSLPSVKKRWSYSSCRAHMRRGLWHGLSLYSTKIEYHFLMKSEQALPLMNIVFGQLVGDFNGYFIPNSTVTEAQFKSSVNKNSYAS